MRVGIDAAGNHQLSARVDRAIDGASHRTEILADGRDGPAFNQNVGNVISAP